MIDKYIEKDHTSTCYNHNIADIYAKRNKNNHDTGFIAYRDIPNILKKLYHISKNKALDFGCGTGLSSFLLAEAGYNVIGVDPNENMLKHAKIMYSNIKFKQIRPFITDFSNKSFDLIFCAFVLLEISSMKDMKKTLDELRRIIKKDGRLIILTTSEYFPKNNWLTAKNNIQKNQTLKPEENYRVLDIKNNMIFSDFYYDDKSYIKSFLESNFKVDNLYQPLGKKTDNINWTTEWKIPPYSIYICSPIT